MYLYLRDRKAAQRYDRTVLKVGVVLIVVAFAGFGFMFAYAVQIIASGCGY